MAFSYWRKLRLLNRDARLYLLTPALLGLTVRGGVYAVVLNLYLLRLGYGPEWIGLVNGTSGGVMALASLPIGALSARWNARYTMIGGLSLLLAGYGALPLAERLGPTPLRAAYLIAIQALIGLGMTFYLVHASPYLMAVTGPRERDHAYALQAALWPLAAFAGSLIGGALPALWGHVLSVPLDQVAPYRYTLVVASVLLAPCIAPLCLARDAAQETGPGAQGTEPDRSHHEQEPVGTALMPLSFSLFAPIVLVGMLRVAGESAVRSFFNVYLDQAPGLPRRLPPAQIGALMALGQLVAVPAALVTPLVTARLGRHRTVALGALCTGASLLPLSTIPHPVAAAASWIGLTTLVSITRPAFMVYTQHLVHPRWRPLMSGATNLAAGLGSALILLSGGYAVAALGFRRFFLIPAGLFALAGGVFGLCVRAEKAKES